MDLLYLSISSVSPLEPQQLHQLRLCADFLPFTTFRSKLYTKYLHSRESITSLPTPSSLVRKGKKR